MRYEKIKVMVVKLMEKAESLRYGSASVTVKIHDGRVVQVSYSTQEHTREQAGTNEKEEQ
jgi:hypothetical protein